MQAIIDRIEGDEIVLELDGDTHVNIPHLLIPNGREGDVVDIEVNVDATNARHDKVKKLQDMIFQKKN